MDQVKNVFDERLEEVNDSRNRIEEIRYRLIKGVQELNEAKRTYNNRQKEFTESEVEIVQLKSANHELKVLLMKALIEKDELISRKTYLASRIESLRQEIDVMEEDTNTLLHGDDVNKVCQLYSAKSQMELTNKIRAAKLKLMNYGFQPSHIR